MATIRKPPSPSPAARRGAFAPERGMFGPQPGNPRKPSADARTGALQRRLRPIQGGGTTTNPGTRRATRAPGRLKRIQPTRPGQKMISFHPGALHRQLGVAVGQTIPAARMRKARSGALGPLAKRRALFARNVLKG